LPASKNYAVDHGDCVEAILTDDKRYHAESTREACVLSQIHEAARARMPIRDKLLCILYGNHEDKLHRFGNLTVELCRQIWGDDSRYGTYAGKLVYHNNKGLRLFSHYATHGRKSIGSAADDIERQLANQRIQLKRHLYRKQGDCLLMSKGHTHKLMTREPSEELYVVDDGLELQHLYKHQGMCCDQWIDPDSRWYVNTGCFIKTFVMDAVTYSEMAEYDPVDLGLAIVRWRGDKIEGIDRILI
jgi:hypothetical protein